MKKESKYSTPAHKRAQENFAKAQAERGLVRVQLWVPAGDAEAIKAIAKNMLTPTSMKANVIKISTDRHICNMHSADLTPELISELAALGYRVVI